MVTISIPEEKMELSEEDKKMLKESIKEKLNDNMENYHNSSRNGYSIFDGTYIATKEDTYQNGESSYATSVNTQTCENDSVNHPEHYTYGKIECIDYITDKQFDFCLGNAVKYITRAGHKQDAIEDLRKAIWYIEKEIEVLQNE